MDDIVKIKKDLPILTYALIIINVLIFIVEIVRGATGSTQALLDMGATYTPYIIGEGQWYRLVTAMFLHFDFKHIAGNMFALFMIGPYIEAYFRKWKFAVIYFVSGFFGNLIYMIIENTNAVRMSEYVVGVGASGAVFGLFGAMIVFTIDPLTRRAFPLVRLIPALVLMLAPGIGNPEINLTAHVAGLISGFLTAYTFYYYQPQPGAPSAPQR